MQEHTQIEQDFSEEQLQAITGGGLCEQCQAYTKKIDMHNKEAISHRSFAEDAIQKVEIQQTESDKQFFQQVAKNFQMDAIGHDLQALALEHMLKTRGCCIH